MDSSGGYRDSDLGTGLVEIDVAANAYTAPGVALGYAYRRAGERCPAGYDVVDADKGESNTTMVDSTAYGNRIGNTAIVNTSGESTTISKPRVTLIVRCKGDPSASPDLGTMIPLPDDEQAVSKPPPASDSEAHERDEETATADASDAATTPTNESPALDRSMVATAMKSLKSKLSVCGDKWEARGILRLHVAVDRSGSVSTVVTTKSELVGEANGLADCVKAAVRTATFPRTKAGGSFVFPFYF